MVIFVSQIDGSTAAQCEQLYTATQLGGEVQLRAAEHAMVEVKEPAGGCNKWFDMAVGHEVYLCAGRAATKGRGINPPTRTCGAHADHDYPEHGENPAHGKGLAPVD